MTSPNWFTDWIGLDLIIEYVLWKSELLFTDGDGLLKRSFWWWFKHRSYEEYKFLIIQIEIQIEIKRTDLFQY